MSHARFLVGDVRERMAELPDGSVDLVLTSPPFLALRSYLPADHPDKQLEIGSEANPAAFLDVLLELTAEWGRLLAPHGSIAVELGDTYSGSGPGGDGGGTPLSQATREHKVSGLSGQRIARGHGWPLAKSLALVPELYRIGLAYGINPFTGAESPAGRWLVRNVVRWCRPNPPVGALGDKYRPATTDMVVATRSSKRWFDLDAVRTQPGPEGGSATPGPRKVTGARNDDGEAHRTNNHAAGAPPLDYWVIPTEPYAGSHYATWPRKLCEIPIQSMCPRWVCVVCGEPRRRIVDVEGLSGRDFLNADGSGNDRGIGLGGARPSMPDIKRETVGWTDCGCHPLVYDGSEDAESSRPQAVHGTGSVGSTSASSTRWRRGVVLDPFAGSGTTLAVATGMGRDAVGIDLDPRNADLAQERVGMFLTVDS